MHCYQAIPLAIGLLVQCLQVHGLFEVTPATVTDGITSEMTLQCQVGQLAHAISQILVIQIEKEESGNLAALATLQTGGPARLVAAGLSSRATVKGEMNTIEISNSTLELTIKDPKVTDGGHYICVLTLIDKANVVKTSSFDITISIDVISLNTSLNAIQMINTELRNLENEHRITAQSLDTLTSLTAALETRLSANEGTLSSLEARTQKAEGTQQAMQARLTQLEADKSVCCDQAKQATATCQNVSQTVLSELNLMKNQYQSSYSQLLHEIKANLTSIGSGGQPPVSFSVRFKTTPSGQVELNATQQIMVFDDVLVNEGGAYNVNTGVLTASVSGTYVLMLNFPIKDSDPTRVYHVALTVNHHKTVSQVESGELLHPASVNVIYHLHAGDEVTVEAYQVVGPDSLPRPAVSRYSAYFAGFRLHP